MDSTIQMFIDDSVQCMDTMGMQPALLMHKGNLGNCGIIKQHSWIEEGNAVLDKETQTLYSAGLGFMVANIILDKLLLDNELEYRRAKTKIFQLYSVSRIKIDIRDFELRQQRKEAASGTC